MPSISTTFLGGSHAVSLPSAVGINELDGNQLVVIDGVCSGDRERIFADSFDGPPDVDDLKSAFEKRLSLFRKVVGHALRGCGVGLVDVDSLDGAAKGLWNGDGDGSLTCIVGCSLGLSRCGFDAGVDGLATDSMIENEDFGCSSPCYTTSAHARKRM